MKLCETPGCRKLDGHGGRCQRRTWRTREEAEPNKTDFEYAVANDSGRVFPLEDSGFASLEAWFRIWPLERDREWVVRRRRPEAWSAVPAAEELHVASEKTEDGQRHQSSAVRALDAVRALHYKTRCEQDCCGAQPMCAECGIQGVWPCPTIRAIETKETRV